MLCQILRPATPASHSSALASPPTMHRVAVQHPLGRFLSSTQLADPAGSHPWPAQYLVLLALPPVDRRAVPSSQALVTHTLSWTLQATAPSRPGLCSAAGSAGPPAQTCPAWALKCRTGPGRQRGAHARPHRRPHGIRDQEDDCQESRLASAGSAALCRPSAPSNSCRHGHSAPPSTHTEGASCRPGTHSGRTALHLCAVWVSVIRWV